MQHPSCPTAKSGAPKSGFLRAQPGSPWLSLPQSHRNLSQLPNFAFSVPLAYFFLSQQEDVSEAEASHAHEKASALIQQALIMFPSGESEVVAVGPRRY